MKSEALGFVYVEENFNNPASRTALLPFVKRMLPAILFLGPQ